MEHLKAEPGSELMASSMGSPHAGAAPSLPALADPLRKPRAAFCRKRQLLFVLDKQTADLRG